jgi:hypothetical protein
MSGGNFNWFLHTMLFMHTIYIIQKQANKEKGGRSDDENEEEEEEEAEVDVEDDNDA